MTTLDRVRTRHITLMGRTLTMLQELLSDVGQHEASTLRDLRDGPKGWTALEVLGHLRDFDGFFQGRAELMLAEDNPLLPAYDHEQLAIDRRYNADDVQDVLAALTEHRAGFIMFFQGLNEEQWARTGVHPESGQISLTDALMQVGHHDTLHIEQLLRILKQLP